MTRQPNPLISHMGPNNIQAPEPALSSPTLPEEIASIPWYMRTTPQTKHNQRRIFGSFTLSPYFFSGSANTYSAFPFDG